MWSAFLCCQYYQRYWEFHSDFTVKKKTKIVEILKAHTGRPHFGNFGILFLKLGWRIDATSYFYDQRRPLFRLATVMFRVTPCISLPGEPWTLYVSPLPGELWTLYISSYLDKPELCLYTPTWRTLNLAFIFIPGEPQTLHVTLYLENPEPCMSLPYWRSLNHLCNSLHREPRTLYISPYPENPESCIYIPTWSILNLVNLLAWRTLNLVCIPLTWRTLNLVYISLPGETGTLYVSPYLEKPKPWETWT